MSARRLLFLDIDGVLNSHAFFLSKTTAAQAAAKHDAYALGIEEPRSKEDHAREMIDPAAVEVLNTIIERSGAEVVISSSWRIAYTMGEIGRALGANGFKHRRSVISKTPSGSGARGLQIAEWLAENNDEPVRFAILDDSNDMEHLLPHLVRTGYFDGLKPEHAERVLTLLGVANPPAAPERGNA